MEANRFVSWIIRLARNVSQNLLHSAGFELRRVRPAEDTFNWLRTLDIRTVIDIGANTGQFATQIHGILPEATIYAFEPIKDCFAQLVETMKDVPNFRAFDIGLGSEASETEIHRSKYSPSSSILLMDQLHQEAFPFTKEKTVEKITISRLDDIAGDLKIADNLLVKIDVQGFEDHVFAGGQNVIQKAKILIVEISFKTLYVGQPLFDQIYAITKAMGFNYHGNWTQLLNPVDGSILQADGIFIKENEGA